MEKRPVIIDTDPGIDDAVALAIALFSDELDVKLITTVAGNVSLENVTYNTLRLLGYFGKSVPVASGAAKPLLEPFVDASNVHGKTGLEGFDFDDPDEHLLLKENAVEAMYRVLFESDIKITLVPIGPLTNIALLFEAHPDSKEKVEKIVLMGGAIGRGNRGVYSEFNIATDPEAAKIVLSSGLPIVMAPMDLGPKAIILPEDSSKLENLNKTGQMLFSLFKTHRKRGMKSGLKMYDSCAIAYLLKPDLFDSVDTFVEVELTGLYTRGATLVDLNGYLGEHAPNVTVLTDTSSEAFKDWLFNSLSKCI